MMHLSAEECPHCGLFLDQLDEVYEGFDTIVRRPHDAAGVLRLADRKKVSKWISRAERAFPQLYFCVVTCSLADDQNIRSYGFWLMNRGIFQSIPESASKEGCVMLVIDVNRKEVCLHLGYLLDTAMNEKESFDALTAGHPYLLESNFMQSIEVMLVGVRKYVKRLRRKARRAAKR
jgi:hypothetical protein